MSTYISATDCSTLCSITVATSGTRGSATAAKGQLERAAVTASKAKDIARSEKNLEVMKQTFKEVRSAPGHSTNNLMIFIVRMVVAQFANDVYDNSPVRQVGIDGKLGEPIKNKGLDDNGEPAGPERQLWPARSYRERVRALCAVRATCERSVKRWVTSTRCAPSTTTFSIRTRPTMMSPSYARCWCGVA